MGDWLRRLLYPLVLPLIVATVWLCGWVRQQDDRAARDFWNFPPVGIADRAQGFDPDAALDPDPDAPAAPRPRIKTEFFAAAEADEAAEQQ